jgi:hypothetical protein
VQIKVIDSIRFQDERVWDCGGYADDQQGGENAPGGQLFGRSGLQHDFFSWVSKFLCENVFGLLEMRLGVNVMLLGEETEVGDPMFAPMSKWLSFGCDLTSYGCGHWTVQSQKEGAEWLLLRCLLSPFLPGKVLKPWKVALWHQWKRGPSWAPLCLSWCHNCLTSPFRLSKDVEMQ